jgi:hypothetical protein
MTKQTEHCFSSHPLPLLSYSITAFPVNLLDIIQNANNTILLEHISPFYHEVDVGWVALQIVLGPRHLLPVVTRDYLRSDDSIAGAEQLVVELDFGLATATTCFVQAGLLDSFDDFISFFTGFNVAVSPVGGAVPHGTITLTFSAGDICNKAVNGPFKVKLFGISCENGTVEPP